MHDLRKSCSELGITLVGGHTEITHGLYNPILSGTMIGEVSKEELIHNGNIREGDLLYLTKGVAIEATSIIARERKEEVIGRFGEDFYKRCISFLENPGISVVPDARLVTSALKVAGMHDPTEGGVLTGAYEMARRSGTGLVIHLERIPIFPETKLLCEHFGLSPYGAVASGSLLIAVPKEGKERIEQAFKEAYPSCSALTLIGEFTSKGEPVYVVEGGKKREIHPTGRDEITKLFEK
jgi:hydrogenase maturation factor